MFFLTSREQLLEIVDLSKQISYAARDNLRVSSLTQ